MVGCEEVLVGSGKGLIVDKGQTTNTKVFKDTVHIPLSHTLSLSLYPSFSNTIHVKITHIYNILYIKDLFSVTMYNKVLNEKK